MSRRLRSVSLVLAAMCAAAGCGSTVDLAKVTYTRTTVPAAAVRQGSGGGSSSAAPKTNDPAFTSEKLRKIDACGLLDKNTLTAVGTPDENQVSDFSQCANYMKDPDGKELNITLTLGEGLIESPSRADQNIGGLPAIEQELDDKSACFQTVVTETSPNRGIKIQVGGKAPDLCAVGRTVLGAVVGRIRRDPPAYPATAGTIREVDPCAAVPAADLRTALGADAKPNPTSLHWCTWSASGADVWVWLRSGVDPAKGADPAKTKKVDLGGISATQEAENTASAKCEVSWAQLPLRTDFAEVVSVTFIRYTPTAGEDVCAKAQVIARSLVPKLPKK
ncbi:MAG: hypothetical protein ACJ72N_10330 [Labedaea sp.]